MNIETLTENINFHFKQKYLYNSLHSSIKCRTTTNAARSNDVCAWHYWLLHRCKFICTLGHFCVIVKAFIFHPPIPVVYTPVSWSPDPHIWWPECVRGRHLRNVIKFLIESQTVLYFCRGMICHLELLEEKFELVLASVGRRCFPNFLSRVLLLPCNSEFATETIKINRTVLLNFLSLKRKYHTFVIKENHFLFKHWITNLNIVISKIILDTISRWKFVVL